MFRVASFGLLALALVSCEEGKDCPAETPCPQGASCRCDAAGHVLTEKLDLNADGEVDLRRYQRTASGAVEIEQTDYSDDGSVERQVTYRYDAEGRRTGRTGWQLRCDASRFQWECSFETPCAPPFEECSACVNRHLLDEGKGLKPCGATAKKEEREQAK